MPVDIKIEYDDRKVRRALRRLAVAERDLTPALREIAAALEGAAEEAFEQQQSPDGTAWDDLSDVTKDRRAKKKKWPGKILQVERRLYGSLTSRYDADSAEAGVHLDSAPTHQFGAKQGEFGTTRRGAPIPWGDIPARPFLGRSDDLDAEILDAIERHFEQALRG